MEAYYRTSPFTGNKKYKMDCICHWFYVGCAYLIDYPLALIAAHITYPPFLDYKQDICT